MVPEKNFAVAVLSNAAQGDPGSITNRLTGFYLAEELEPMAVAGAGPGAGEGDDEAPPEPIVDVPDAELERVAGAYWSEEANLLRRIRVEEGRLVYDRAGGNESPLAPLGDDRFLMTGVAVRVEVVFEPAGQKPQRMIVNVSDDEPMVAVAIEVFEPGAAELEVYSGQYRSAELAMDVELLVEDGELVLRHRRHGDIPLEPMMEDMFGSSAWWLGQLRFERGANGQPTGFRSNSGRVMNLLFTRQ